MYGNAYVDPNEKFTSVEETPEEVAAEEQHKNDKPIVIIGTGIAGYTLVKELRRIDKETPVIIITSDDGRNYSKPMLSTGYTKGKDADDEGCALHEGGTVNK